MEIRYETMNNWQKQNAQELRVHSGKTRKANNWKSESKEYFEKASTKSMQVIAEIL